MLQLDMALHVLYLTLFILVVRIATSIQIERGYQVALIEALNVYNTSYRGLDLTDGYHGNNNYRYSPAVLLRGDLRELRLPVEISKKALSILSRSNEFTLMATLRQEQRNAGTILAFSEGNGRFLELQSSGRKNEIRLQYYHNNLSRMETFPYRLADNTWHKLSVTVSGNNVAIYVDCSLIYKRVIYDIDRNFTDRNITLWLGQRNTKHFFFKGSLQDVRIIGRPHGYTLQCSNLATDCPTCGQFRELQISVKGLENHLKELLERLAQAEQRISAVEECECQKNCFVNGSVHRDGARWKHNCDICNCVRGFVQCNPIKCPITPCKNPVILNDPCCPECRKNCLLEGVEYDDGETFTPRDDCTVCTCEDGTTTCRRETTCPELTCPESEQFKAADECCTYCRGMDFCSQGHNCHVNATCINLSTKHICQCNNGYQGNGTTCDDVDECKTEGGHYGHHCRINTTCVNIPGSYVCECLTGYKKWDTFTCKEHDECSSDDHNCDENAVCINTDGSYICQCKEGFVGDGFICKPVCNQTCVNGGQCIAPNVCGCRRGYTGNSCEIDIDECSLGLHTCYPNARCVNMPGWYFCECKQGFQSRFRNNSGILCEDIDECELHIHTCHPTAICVNEKGSFSCKCKNSTTCSLNCMYYDDEKYNGEKWISPTNPCHHCNCYNGVVHCERSCDCSNSNVDTSCCPHCYKNRTCKHQESSKIIQNGEKWIYQCQTCECLNGEIDCWEMECPPVSCTEPTYRPGDCCIHCEEQTCSQIVYGNNLSLSIGCMYHDHTYSSGEVVPVAHDQCASCKCQVPHCEHSVSNTGYSSHRMDNSAAHTTPIVWLILVSLLLICPYSMIGREIYFLTDFLPLKTVPRWKTCWIFLLLRPVQRMIDCLKHCFLCQRTSHLIVLPKRNPTTKNSIQALKIPI